MIVVPRSELKKFSSRGQQYANSVGGSGKILHLTPDQYATLQRYVIRKPNRIGPDQVSVKRCGLHEKFAPEALQLFHLDALANGTAEKNPFTVRRMTWEAAQKYRLKPKVIPSRKPRRSTAPTREPTMPINDAIQIKGMNGIGDTLYLRAVVREFINQNQGKEIYVCTPWPQLWTGLPVRAMKSTTSLRTQRQNEDRSDEHYNPPRVDSFGKRHHIGYGGVDFRDGKSILDACAVRMNIDLPETMSLGWSVPDDWKWRRDGSEWTNGKFKFYAEKPLAFVRPPTVRREWAAPGRNPDPAAFIACVNHLRKTHHVISVASAIEPHERIVTPIEADTRFELGELDFNSMFGLLASSDVAFGGVGFLLPAALSHRVKTIILAGGALGGNGPSAVMPRQLDWSNVRMIFPDDGHQCWCTNYRHQCDRKTDPGRAIHEMRSALTSPAQAAA